MNTFVKLADVFFNGRPADSGEKVTVADCIKRGSSVVRLGRKYYRITCQEVKLKVEEKK